MALNITVDNPITSESVSEVAAFFQAHLGTDGAVDFLESVILSMKGESVALKKRMKLEEYGDNADIIAVPKKYNRYTFPFKGDETDEKPITLINQVVEDMALVSNIIGKGGKNVTHIIQESGCKVQVERQGNHTFHQEIEIQSCLRFRDQTKCKV
jgi:hypothetical protein